MGVLAQLIMFANAQHKLKCLARVDESLSKRREYDKIMLYNPNYNLNLKIPLYIEVYKQKLLRFRNKFPFLGDAFYRIRVEVPIEHDSLDGKWKVKELKEVLFYHYGDPEIENIGILITYQGSKAIKGALRALEKLDVRPAITLIEIPSGSLALDVLKRLGGIGWTFVSEIVDSHLAHVALYGKQLENSEVLEDFLRRGGRIKAAVLYNEREGLKIILSTHGRIYSQRKIPLTKFAADMAKVIKEFKTSNLLRVK